MAAEESHVAVTSSLIPHEGPYSAGLTRSQRDQVATHDRTLVVEQ
jgi:hypothetical protein